ncbi:Neuronal acetylcholine receptor subunit alpha-10 [Mizuhopecten yessoensis]|uniref:Neuronal acetylcholine receptor subunit alpha-10 n=1 Tax=Mizuhopecten yessoensis TaxID=6573 RepID=A0A210PHE1_MIZYE|nr:Neuronal acetylcholine receptor subunit alpha-10 [Mizuhopecten yessoensis]
MNILASLVVQWNDVSLVWDPAAYNELYDINIGQNNIWLPKLYNIKASNSFSAISDSDFLVNIANNGKITWQPGGFIDVKFSQDVSYFPFDRQTCSIQLAPWGYLQNKVQLRPVKTEISLNFYETNGEWSLDGTLTGTDLLSQISLTHFNISISRLPAFHVVNTLMPIYLLLVMNPLVFVLPFDSGERVGFSLTVFLTFTVFITIVNDVLPANSESMSILSYFIFAILVVSGIIASMNIFQLRLYHKDENLPVPRWLVRLMRILGCHCRKSRRRVIEVCPVHAVPKSLDKISSKKGLTIQEEENATEGTEQDLTWKDVARILDTFYMCMFYTFITVCSIATVLNMYQGNK